MFSFTNNLVSAVASVFLYSVFTSSILHTAGFLREWLEERRWQREVRRYITTKRKLSTDSGIELPVQQGSDDMLAVNDISDMHQTSMENKEGMVFNETTVVETTHTAPMSVLAESNQDIADDLRILSIPVRVASGNWTTSQLEDTPLWTLNYNNAHLSNDRWSDIFQRYIFFRYRVKVRVEVNGTPFHQGKLMLYYSPGLPAGGQYGILANNTSLEFRSIYPSYNNVQELKMPWQYHLDYARVDPNSQFVSFISLAVFNILAVGTGGSTSIGYTVYISLEDVELKVPAPTTVPASLLSALPLINEGSESQQEMPVQQGFLDFSTTVVNNKFGDIANSTLPTNVSGDKFDTKVDVRGLDDPNWTINPTGVKVRALDSMSNTTGISSSYRMALNPSKMITPGPEYFDVAEDEMSLKYLTRRWSLLTRTISFANSSVVGTPLFQCFINPGIMGGALPNGLAPTPAYRPLLQFLAQRFSRYRGSVSFAVEVIATQYQTGKLFLGYHPYYTAPVASTAGNPDNLTNYGMVVEINKGKNVFEIEIPYFGLTDWSTILFSNNSTAATVNSDVNGFFYICPVNQLSAPTGSPNTCSLNVYVRGGEDFEFCLPIGQGVSAVTQGEVGKIGRASKSRGTCVYEDVPMSVRDLIRRPMYYTGTQLTGIVGSSIKFALISLDGVLNELNSGTTSQVGGLNNNMAYWMSLYRGYVGDLRAKVMITRKTPTFIPENNGVNVEENNYPVHVAHIPTYFGTNPASTVITPTEDQIMQSTRLWLAQRYSQASQDNPRTNIVKPGFGNNQIPLMNIGSNSYPTQQACCLFEETIIDPIKAIELEIPYNGVARFATRRDWNDQPCGLNSHRSGWGYLLIHQWANQPVVADSDTSFDYTWADIYLSAADNLRYGMHTGIPNLAGNNTSTANPFGRYVN
jgi:hypothetical protein